MTAGAALRATEKSLLDGLATIVGADNVRTGDAAAAFATDVYRALEPPAAVVRPQTVAQLQAVVRAANAADAAILVRGGGASYTDGYLPTSPGAVLIDMGGLDRIIEINEAAATVTVEAGVTWAALKAALAARGLRTPFWGPFSGLVATVGGSLSQNTLSHGSGAYGVSAQSVIAMEIVLANGDMLRTGAAAFGLAPFTRYAGPDLTGLFTGDCGALGVKATVTLPLITTRPAFEAASFAFASFAELHAGMRAASLEALDDTHFALDQNLSQGQIARQDSQSAMIAVAVSVLRSSPNLVVGFGQLGRMAMAGQRDIISAAYACHYIIEGVDLGEARAKLNRLRTIMASHGREIANTVPAVVRAMPFAPLYNTLGPKGERWVPLHGVLSHEAATNFHDAAMMLLTGRAADMERLGIWTGAMFESVQSTGILYEFALYWPDAQTAYHKAAIPGDYLSTLPVYPDNPEARDFIESLKQALTALYDAHGAVHFQLGKMYPYASRLEPTALAAIRAVKRVLDPKGLMNPGALGL